MELEDQTRQTQTNFSIKYNRDPEDTVRINRKDPQKAFKRALKNVKMFVFPFKLLNNKYIKIKNAAQLS